MRFCGLSPGSLRAKMTLSSILMLAVGIVVATFISSMGVRHYLVTAVDNRLTGSRDSIDRSGITMREVASLVRFTGLDDAVEPGVAEAAGSRNVFVPVDETGRPERPFGRPPTESQRALAAAVPDPATLARDRELVDVRAGDGRPYRATAVRLADGQLVLMATEVGAAGEIMRKVIRLEVMVGAGLTVVLGAALFVGWRRRLRPMEDMVEAASAIAEGYEGGEPPADGPQPAGHQRLDLSRRLTPRGGRHHQVTEVERLRVALNAMLHQVEAAFLTREHAAAHLRRFVADASHELRTPLAAIRGYLQLYERGMLTGQEEKARAFRRMTAETERMARLVDELLALARLDQRPELRPAPVDVAALVREALADLAAQQPERPVTCVAHGEPCVALADEATLRQVVGNLITNVRVHTAPSDPVHVSVLAAGGGTCVLQVRDEGPGMRPEDAERVFDRFFRTGPAGAQGSGLGMSVVRAGVAAQRGTVRVVTSPGAGLTVTVRLPAAPALARA